MAEALWSVAAVPAGLAREAANLFLGPGEGADGRDSAPGGEIETTRFAVYVPDRFDAF